MAKFTVVFYRYIGYNRNNLRCLITPVSFEPTFTLNGIPILSGGCQALTLVLRTEDWKGRQKPDCGRPPSIARSHKTGGGILGEENNE